MVFCYIRGGVVGVTEGSDKTIILFPNVSQNFMHAKPSFSKYLYHLSSEVSFLQRTCQGHPELSTIFPVNPSISPNLPHWHLVWALTNGKTCNLIFAITELKQHVLSLVQTTIGFGAPCRTGSSSPQTKPSYKRLRDSLGLC